MAKKILPDCPLEPPGTIATQAQGESSCSVCGTEAQRPSKDRYGHPVRPAHGRSLACPSRHQRFSFRIHLLASPSAMAKGGDLATPLRGTSRRTSGDPPDRLVSRSGGQFFVPSALRRRENRPKSHGSAQAGQQAPSAHRCPRHPLSDYLDRSQPSRCYPVAAVARQHPACERQGGRPTFPTKTSSRRPCL